MEGLQMTDEQTAHMQHPDQMDPRDIDREYCKTPNAGMSKYVETIQKVSKGTNSDLKVFKGILSFFVCEHELLFFSFREKQYKSGILY